MTASGGDSRGRTLGFAESMHQLFVTKYSTCIYWHVGVIQSKRPLQVTHINKALKILARKQEALQMRILPLNPKQKNPTEFKFEPMVDPQKIDFEVISMSSKADWPNVISQFHVVKKIEHADGPLWRFILGQVDTKEKRNDTEHANEYVLLFQFHHAIIDGKSASDLMCHQLLPILSAVANGHDAENMFPFVPQTKSLEGLFCVEGKIAEPSPMVRETPSKCSTLEKPDIEAS